MQPETVVEVAMPLINGGIQMMQVVTIQSDQNNEEK